MADESPPEPSACLICKAAHARSVPCSKRVADRFEVKRLVGEGGMGAVFEAHDTALDRSVALKVLLPRYAHDADLRRRFVREAKGLAQLSCVHVVQILDVNTDDPAMPFMVMEFLRGQDCAALLDQHPNGVDADRVLRIARQVCEGLSAVHEAGYIHRDLKPSNLFIERHAKSLERVKILDFGIAKDTTPDASGASQTRTDAVFGSPPYMSPEQVAGNPGDQRSDIFALGVVLYELLSGKRPFVGRTEVQIWLAIAEAKPVSLMALKPHLAPALCQLVHRALAKEPDQRFANIDDFRNALCMVADGPTPSAPPGAFVPTKPSRDSLAQLGLAKTSPAPLDIYPHASPTTVPPVSPPDDAKARQSDSAPSAGSRLRRFVGGAGLAGALLGLAVVGTRVAANRTEARGVGTPTAAAVEAAPLPFQTTSARPADPGAGSTGQAFEHPARRPDTSSASPRLRSRQVAPTPPPSAVLGTAQAPAPESAPPLALETAAPATKHDAAPTSASASPSSPSLRRSDAVSENTDDLFPP